MKWTPIGFALLLSSAAAASAHAQEGNKFALGASFTARATPDSAARGGQGPGIKWRFGHSENGWGWHYGLDWYALDVDRPAPTPRLELGELHIRPFMGGYGYTHVVGRVAVTADVIGGYALTSFRMTSGARDALSLSGRSADVEVGGTPVIKPEVETWIDLNRKMGLIVNAGYMIARPRLTMPTTFGSDTRRFRADAMEITFGTVYRIF
jgi:hypothetical protein